MIVQLNISDVILQPELNAAQITITPIFSSGVPDVVNKQYVDDRLLLEIRKLVLQVYDFFTNLDVALISEAAKSEKNWQRLIQTRINPMNMEVVSSYLITNEEHKARYETQSDDAKAIVKYEAKQTISNLRLKFWDGLCLFMLKQDCLSVYQQTYVSIIRKKLRVNGDLTDIEIENGIKILIHIKEYFYYNYTNICKFLINTSSVRTKQYKRVICVSVILLF